MRILFVSTSSGSRGGGELALLSIGESQLALGHQVSLWCSNHPRMDQLAEKFSVLGVVHRSNYPNSYYDRKFHCLGAAFDCGLVKRVAAEWGDINPDVIHLNKQNLEDGLDLVVALEVAKIPSICMIHITQSAVWLGARLGLIRDWMSSRVLRRYRGKLVTTPETRAVTLRAVVGEQVEVRVIDNGVRPLPAADHAREECRKAIGVDDGDILLITLGRIEAQKQPLEMLEIAWKLKQTFGGRLKYVWVGSGSMEAEWLERRKTLGLDDCVFQVPWSERPGDWLAAADAMLHTAKFEGMPFAVLEGLAAGLPVCLLPELIAEVPPFDADGVVRMDAEGKWVELILKEESRRTISESARQLHSRCFSLDRMGRSYESLYQLVREEASP